MFQVLRFKFQEKGITIIEIVVASFIIALFSAIIITNFPKILKQSALSRVSYKLAQDFRKTQDLGLSGIKILDASSNPILASGYGIYLNRTSSTKQYIIYADVKPNSTTPGDSKYNDAGSHNCVAYGVSQPYNCCDQDTSPTTDCVVEIIDISKENPDLYIKAISNIIGPTTSINFSPPGPTTKIDRIISIQNPIGITLGITSDTSATRTIQVNTSGLINVQ